MSPIKVANKSPLNRTNTSIESTSTFSHTKQPHGKSTRRPMFWVTIVGAALHKVPLSTAHSLLVESCLGLMIWESRKVVGKSDTNQDRPETVRQFRESCTKW